MIPAQLYQNLLQELCGLTGLSMQAILHSNLEECADARSVLVQCLSLYLTDTQIAALLGRTRQGINFIRTGFDARRRKWAVESNWKAMRKYMESNLFPSK